MTSPGPAFAAEDLLAGRFKIVRFVAHGGMGEVYEAEDLTLRERVALKTVRPEVASDAKAIERFMQEVHLARQVTHPNACRIFDVFQHRSGGGPENGIVFVTMELLPGETLADRLRRSGPLATADALPLVRQIVAALTAAHRAGVVHRDLKSDNVALVPAPGEEAGLRAVVADFGLARGRATEGGDASLTEIGLIVGTPAYMAPEQMEGHDVTAASDIYSLGVVMYEMVTGRLPFPGETAAAGARRLKERAPSPRTHVPDLDPRWEEVILRCLERDPIDRFASVADVVRALAGEKVTSGRRVLVRRHAREVRMLRIGRAALVLAALALVVLGGYLVYRTPRPAGPSAAVEARRSVAVLGFKNLSGRPDAAWLSTALSEMLSAELAAGEKIRTIPGESVARTKIELSLPDADTLAKDTLARLRGNLGSDFVVLGSYFAAGREGGGKLRVDLRLQDTAKGEMVASLTDAGTEADLLDLVSRTGTQLREKLGAGQLSTAQKEGLRAALPSNPEAARLYSEGLGKLRLFDALAARDLLEKAVVADPDSPLAHTALAGAWSTLGYDGKAKEEAKRALDLSAGLAREERLFVEGRYYEAAKQWERAIETYGTLWGFFADNVEYGLRLASAQTFARKGQDALATVESLRRLPPPARDDPRIDLSEAFAAQEVADLKRQQALAERAAKKGEAQGARLLMARALLLEVEALSGLGQLERANALAREAHRIFEAAGDRSGVANAIANIGGVSWFQGDLETAKRMFEKSLDIARDIGDLRRISWQQHALGDVLRQQGDLDGARRMYEGSLATDREMGHRSAATLQMLGVVLLERGDLKGARSLLEQFLAVSRDIGERSLIARGLSSLADVSLAEGELADSREQHEEALAIREEIGQKGFAAESRLALGVVSVEEEKLARAEDLAQQAAEEFQKERQAHNEALAHAVLAEALLADRKLALAGAEVDRTRALLERSQGFGVSVTVAITAARVRAASGRPADAAEALKALEATLARARTAGFVGLQFEARLALGQIEMKAGRTAAGRARLEALEKEASAKGFGLVAKKAGAAAAQRP